MSSPTDHNIDQPEPLYSPDPLIVLSIHRYGTNRKGFLTAMSLGRGNAGAGPAGLTPARPAPA